MFGAIFYAYKKEVQKMNDLIELKLITREDAECLHKLQIEAFMPLYEKYQDDATSPAKASVRGRGLSGDISDCRRIYGGNGDRPDYRNRSLPGR